MSGMESRVWPSMSVVTPTFVPTLIMGLVICKCRSVVGDTYSGSTASELASLLVAPCQAASVAKSVPVVSSEAVRKPLAFAPLVKKSLKFESMLVKVVEAVPIA